MILNGYGGFGRNGRALYGTAAMRAEFGRIAQLFAAILTVFHGKFLLVRFSLRNGLAGQSVGKIKKTKAIV